MKELEKALKDLRKTLEDVYEDLDKFELSDEEIEKLKKDKIKGTKKLRKELLKELEESKAEAFVYIDDKGRFMMSADGGDAIDFLGGYIEKISEDGLPKSIIEEIIDSVYGE